MSEWAQFIGVPYEDKGRSFAGADCWGLAVLVHRHIFDNDLPLLGDSYATVLDLDEVNAAYEATHPLFQGVVFEDRLPGDILMFRVQGVPVHCGVCIDENRMVHTLPGHASVCEHYTRVTWQRRLEGLYRWAS